MRCPNCGNDRIRCNGHSPKNEHCQKYLCMNCRKNFYDLTGTVFSGRHQPLGVWVMCLYLMCLNLSNRQISQELDLSEADAQKMTGQLREEVQRKTPEPLLSDVVELDEAYIVAGHKGHQSTVRDLGRRGKAESAEGRKRQRHFDNRKASHIWTASTTWEGCCPHASKCKASYNTTYRSTPRRAWRCHQHGRVRYLFSSFPARLCA